MISDCPSWYFCAQCYISRHHMTLKEIDDENRLCSTAQRKNEIVSSSYVPICTCTVRISVYCILYMCLYAERMSKRYSMYTDERYTICVHMLCERVCTLCVNVCAQPRIKSCTTGGTPFYNICDTEGRRFRAVYTSKRREQMVCRENCKSWVYVKLRQWILISLVVGGVLLKTRIVVTLKIVRSCNIRLDKGYKKELLRGM